MRSVYECKLEVDEEEVRKWDYVQAVPVLGSPRTRISIGTTRLVPRLSIQPPPFFCSCRNRSLLVDIEVAVLFLLETYHLDGN